MKPLYVLLGLSFAFVLFQNFSVPSQKKSDNKVVEINISKTKINKIRDDYFGANFLIWHYDDLVDVKRRKAFSDSLKKLGVSKLRYPGGNISQNYDMKTGVVVVPEIEPKQKQDINRKQMPTVSDFCSLLQEIGARGAIPINIETDFVYQGKDGKNYVRKDFENVVVKSVANTTELVKKIQKSNCPVNQWEIGNESNHGELVYSYSVDEYAQMVLAHTKAIRALQPQALIGINNGNPLTFDLISLRDRLTAEGDRALLSYSVLDRSLMLAKYSKSDRDSAAKKLNGGKVVQNPRKWWPYLLSKVADKIDYVVVHKYVELDGNVEFGKEFNSFSRLIFDKIGRHLPLSISEYGVDAALKNVPKYDYLEFSLDHAAYISEMINSRTLDIHAFDLKFNEKSYLDYETYELTPAGEVFKLYANAPGEYSLKIEKPANEKNIFISALSEDNKTITVFVTNKTKVDKKIKLNFEQNQLSVLDSKILVPQKAKKTFAVDYARPARAADSGFVVEVPAGSVSRFNFEIK